MRAVPAILLATSLLIGTGGSAGAAKLQDPRVGQMEEIFFLSGLEAQLADFERGMDEGLQGQMSALSTPRIEMLRRAAARSFAADRLRDDVRHGLVDRYEARGAAGTLAWLRSPLGREITRMETRASRPEAMAELETYARGLTGEPPSASRIALIDALIEATGGSEFGVDMALAAAHGVASAANATQPAAQRAPEAAIAAAIEAQRPAIERDLDAFIQISSLYTYRELSDAELSAYVDFARSDAGAWYHQAVVKELVRVIRQAAAGLGAVVAQEMGEMPSGAASLAP